MSRRTDLTYWEQRINAQLWVKRLKEQGAASVMEQPYTLYRMEEIHKRMTWSTGADDVSTHVLARMLHDVGFHRAGNGFGVRTCHGQRRLWVLVPDKKLEALEAGALYDEERKS